jgi:DNA-directed RNA polymerase subunit RPC12/RpoP/Flp pilus assembly protein TadB
VIQFSCPSCSSTCSVDDRYSGRKLKCPKCGARVLHLKDREVKLLTAGSALPSKAAAPASGAPPPGDVTPVATAALPHTIGELVGQSESRQNLYVGAGLLAVFTVVAVVLGLMLGVRLLVVAPIAVLLSTVGIYLWFHTRKLKKRLSKK